MRTISKLVFIATWMHDWLHIDAALKKALREHDGWQRVCDDDETDDGASIAGIESPSQASERKTAPLRCRLLTRSGSRCRISSAFSVLAAITGGMPTL